MATPDAVCYLRRIIPRRICATVTRHSSPSRVPDNGLKPKLAKMSDSDKVYSTDTIDAAHDETYNRENCITARKPFESQPGVIVRYWCEPAAQP